MSSVTCVARFASPTALPGAYRDCVVAMLGNRTFLGFHLHPYKITDHDCRAGMIETTSALAFAINPAFSRLPYFDAELQEVFFTSKMPMETLDCLETPDGYDRLRRAALTMAEVFGSSSTKTTCAARKKAPKTQRTYAIFAEFESPTRAAEVRETLYYRPFKRLELNPFVLSADSDPNPCCVKITIGYWDRASIRELGQEFDAARITRNYQELYQKAQVALAVPK